MSVQIVNATREATLQDAIEILEGLQRARTDDAPPAPTVGGAAPIPNSGLALLVTADGSYDSRTVANELVRLAQTHGVHATIQDARSGEVLGQNRE